MKLDKFQSAAVNSTNKNTLVVAAPGSGKTTVIINRIDKLVSEFKIGIGYIIVITFTKAAALNMKERYKKRFNRDRAPFFGTFHGLFYKILLREGYSINIIEGFKVNKLIEGVLKKFSDEVSEDKIKEVLNDISLFKNARMPLSQFSPTVKRDIFEECYRRYEGYKEHENLMDFDDLALRVIELLENNESALNNYRSIFKYILVDEFQDCDQLQIEFLSLINSSDENSLFAVGDEDQCIYSFRGSKPEYMVIFDEIFGDSKKYYLAINYRSNKNIIHGSKNLIKNNDNRNDKLITSFKETDGIIKVFNPYDEKFQGEKIVEVIKENYNNLQYSYNENIVLYRTNMEAMSFIDVFTRKGVPFTLLDREYNFFEHFICKDILTYLKLSLNINDRESFIRIINKPFRYISKSNIAYVKNFREDKNPFDILIEKNDTKPFQAKSLSDLKKDIIYLNKLTLSSAIQFIISDLGYMDYLKKYADDFGQSLDDLEEILEEFKISASEFKTIFEFFEHVDRVKGEIEDSKDKSDEDRVILSTIHRVKGMEFRNVFVANCNEETIPHISAGDSGIEEERRLFYVAITRAIDNLYILAPKTKGGKFREVSRFIKETEFKTEEEEIHGFTKGAEVYHNGRKEWGMIKEISGDKISILFKDGVTRSYSIKILLERNLLMGVNINSES